MMFTFSTPSVENRAIDEREAASERSAARRRDGRDPLAAPPWPWQSEAACSHPRSAPRRRSPTITRPVVRTEPSTA
jgi:hypothetical protein